MIQKTNARAGSSTVAAEDPDDGPRSWGNWVGRRYYSLEVVQHPLRARMCGFGDKDRRPLAPAAVAKMIVQRDDGSIVDVEEIDCSFFLVTVDLWSADGKHEMNLVLHPTSADRYVLPPTSADRYVLPANHLKAKRRAAANAAHQRSGRDSPPPASASQDNTQPNAVPPYMAPPSAGYSAQVYPYPAQPPSDPQSYQPMASYGSSSEAPMPWGYPPQATSMDRASQYPPPPVLRPIHSAGRSNSTTGGPAAGVSYNSAGTSRPGAGEDWPLENPGREDAEGMPYRTWPQDASYSPLDNNSVSHSSGAIEPSLRHSHGPPSNHEHSYASSETYTQNRYSQEQYNTIGHQQPIDAQGYPQAPYTQQPPPGSHYHDAQYAQEPTPPSNMPPLPRHTYTRTLVGPLSANACSLVDEHRKPGIFFLFQDLSVRTEGTFRLRLRLMNVGAPPAPEGRASRIHTGVSPVLAQTFTEPFVVFSAKRFPGVPDTTALSIALGSQGQKLPLRNRNGSAKLGRKRLRSGSSALSGDESDEGGT
ncbi:uncharacterized protein LAESUDRAFT_175547 [Laetiporus sulphureus 93-53]|uniref:Velvet domain-containing protein n=1 Tax=Laetiporus sulphureus 93-53 TaxID=1314785 RepID=A0A165E7L5_9APHY|nr:uncharacterized protein LAESUDRAFT_175547 [Laetiporus sulphureus 93-53]KZT06394.1 hypothetical protein LAESUDRAFT_175547 [Laetiporus sulphureus 93-53]